MGRRAESVGVRKGGEVVEFVRGVKCEGFRQMVRGLNESMGLCLM